MRRKNRYMISGAAIVGGIALAADVLQQRSAKQQEGAELAWDNFDYRQAFKKTMVGIGLGVLAGYVCYEYSVYEENKIPFNPDEYLRKILSQEHLKNNPRLLKVVLNQRNKIKEWALRKFGPKLATFPQDAGSFVKRTAIATNFDLDILLIFKRNSYYSLKDMYYEVYDSIQRKFGTIAIVEKQTKGVSIVYDYEGIEIYFDIVPGRKISNRISDKNINLYVRPDWSWQRGSSFKTNHEFHKKSTVNKPEARQVIKLLKIYRDNNKLCLPSIIIEQYVINAMSERNFGINTSITENLLNSMDYIARKIILEQFSDIANVNNNLHSKLSYSSRASISHYLLKDLKRIEDRPSFIKEIFGF